MNSKRVGDGLPISFFNTTAVAPGPMIIEALYQRVVECINARKELGIMPIQNGVADFLASSGYDEEFIEKFISKVNNHKGEDCLGF